MIIENSKTYDVNDVENLFFRPSFCGNAAEDLGIRVIYNMPLPTKVPVFTHNNDILKPFSSGWQGGSSSTMVQKEIKMHKVKAESAYSAEDYFSTIYELVTNSADTNLGDLTGTELEKAETELFRRAIADSIYASTWFGDMSGSVSSRENFSGFFHHIIDGVESGENYHVELCNDDVEMPIIQILRESWNMASDELRALASDGQLVFFVSSDIYDAYHFYLEENGVTLYNNDSTSRPILKYHGITLVEVPTKQYNVALAYSFCILTDRRNFVLALNTADAPEKEIRMWYNPDEMENRQRVVFLAGTTIVDPALVSGYVYNMDLTLV